jgi:hypothetical protein
MAAQQAPASETGKYTYPADALSYRHLVELLLQQAEALKTPVVICPPLGCGAYRHPKAGAAAQWRAALLAHPARQVRMVIICIRPDHNSQGAWQAFEGILESILHQGDTPLEVLSQMPWRSIAATPSIQPGHGSSAYAAGDPH